MRICAYFCSVLAKVATDINISGFYCVSFNGLCRFVCHLTAHKIRCLSMARWRFYVKIRIFTSLFWNIDIVREPKTQLGFRCRMLLSTKNTSTLTDTIFFSLRPLTQSFFSASTKQFLYGLSIILCESVFVSKGIKICDFTT